MSAVLTQSTQKIGFVLIYEPTDSNVYVYILL